MGMTPPDEGSIDILHTAAFYKDDLEEATT